MADDRIFKFYTDEGCWEVTYAEYLANTKLRSRVTDPNRYRLFLGRSIYSIDYGFLKNNPEFTTELRQLEQIQKREPIRFYAPTSQEVVDFLNDDDHDAVLRIGPNRTGKTTAVIVKILLLSIPCDPKWWMFSRYGVKHREFTGPKKIGLATDLWRKHREVFWPEVKLWTPDDQLGVYGKTYRYKHLKEGPNWKDSPVIPLACKSKFYFYCYEQAQSMFESQALDIWGWDEQPPENLFDGADERTRTRQSKRHFFSFTPIKEEGRPDTGKGSWLKRLVDGTKTKGLSPKVYGCGISSMPDWIYPELEKAKAYKKWVEDPQRTGDLKALREGRARYYGEWHETSGLVYDEIDPNVHFIDPFEITGEYTLYRAVDYGSRNPTACLYFAVDDEGFIYAFREYYARGNGAYVDAKNIIELCGNKVVYDDKWVDEITGQEFKRYHEDPVKEVYAKSVLDSRSFNTSESSKRTIGWLFKAGGLHVVPASGAQDPQRIPMVKALLRINPELKNPITGEMGSPRMFFFNTLNNFRREWMDYTWQEWRGSTGEEKNPQEKAKDKDNHLMVCLAYGAQIPLRYFGVLNNRFHRPKQKPVRRRLSSVTGY